MTRRPNKPPRQRKQPRSRPQERRALSHVGGRVETEGDAATCTLLATVVGDEMDAETSRMHVHGFHAYPARMHPTLARRCIELMAPARGRVFDPFCGSGTVLVEARLAGRPSVGTDLNPLAVLLAQLKTYAATQRELDALTAAAHRVAGQAEARRKERRGATKRYPKEDVRLFDPHVLLELDGLRDAIGAVSQRFAHDALQLVLSSLLVKVSRQAGDTAAVEAPKRLAAGYAIKLFERKAGELARRMAAYHRYLPKPPPEVRVQVCDARNLRNLPDDSVDLVLSSPPYAGTYDYVDHHRMRLRWLGLPIDPMETTEIGARRHLETMRHANAVGRFGREMTDVFAALRRVMRPGARTVLVIADSVVAGKPVWADPLVRRCAEQAGLSWKATASQARPHFHGPSQRAFGDTPRKEHTIVLSRPTRR